MLTRGGPRGDEHGAVTVLFAVLLPLFMMFGAIVITVGSWYTHARQLQTKVDAGALAGGGAWSFPCAADVDARIADTARLYVGDHTAAHEAVVTGSYNPQIGGVEGDQIFVSLNQLHWWDDGFSAEDFTSPSGSVCEAEALDVKATEKDSPLLWGWLPFLPDIKRKARVEIKPAAGLPRVLPIAVRVPRPVASAAVIYDERDGPTKGDILDVRYFESAPELVGLPAGLEGYSTRESDHPQPVVSLPSRAGVAIALSFRPACGTSDANPCFAIEDYTKVDSLCNQGSGTQIVRCYHAGGSWPSQAMGTGLHFLRGYSSGNVTSGPPELRGAFLQNAGCQSNGYFNSNPSGACAARLSVTVDIGSVLEHVGGGGDDDDDDDDDDGGLQQTRTAGNVEVRYRLVRANGTSFCNYGATCELHAAGAMGKEVTYSTQGNNDSPHVPLTAASAANAVAIQVRVRRSSVTPNPGNCGPNAGFTDNCRWFHVGSGIFGTSVPPSNAQILASPVQRAFMGNLDLSGPVKWLRIGKDPSCDGIDEVVEGPAATHVSGSATCFNVDMGLKGAMARDQDEPAFAFNEGTGPSQMGSVDCDPALQQGQVLTDGVVNGCAPDYAANTFATTPLCPGSSQFFTLPKPAPFDDWTPYDCVKTRPTGSMNQLLEGLNMRIFGVKTNPTCPPDNASRYVRGRNYWHRNNNLFDLVNFAWDKDTPASEPDDQGNGIRLDDPRLVTLFLTPYDSFSGSGQEVFPLVSLGSFYVTGYGRLNGSGGLQGGEPEDPCGDGNNADPYDGTGNEPPPDLNELGGSAGGTVVWGHFLKVVVTNSMTTGGTAGDCDPDGFHPCVAVLVE